MKKIILSLIAVAGIAGLISCGGSGGPRTFTATAQGVQKMQRYWLLSLSNSGLGMPFYAGFGGGSTAGSTGSTGSGTSGGGGGFSSMGGFIRNFGGPTGTGAAKAIHPMGGTTGGTNGGSGGEDFYFDNWLQLWVDTQWTNTTFTSLFYMDSAKTMPAGHVISTFADDWDTFPQSYSSDYTYTAGTNAGAHGLYDCTQTSEFEGSMTYNNTYSDGSHDSGSSSWTAIGSNWQSRWDDVNNGGWAQDSGSWDSNGNGTYTSSNSAGWTATWHFNADWSGSAHLEGPDAKLPADLVWTAAGHYKATYSDGSSEEWDFNDLWGDGGGTTGYGGSTGATGVSDGSTAGGGATTGATGSGTTGSGTAGSSNTTGLMTGG